MQVKSVYVSENMQYYFHHLCHLTEFAQSIYNMFDFVAFDNSQELIRIFELHHSSTPAKNIKMIKKQLTSEVKRTTERGKDEADGDYLYNKYPSRNTIHTSLPPNSGCITKSSIAFLYGAIICSALRDKSRSIQFPQLVFVVLLLLVQFASI